MAQDPRFRGESHLWQRVNAIHAHESHADAGSQHFATSRGYPALRGQRGPSLRSTTSSKSVQGNPWALVGTSEHLPGTVHLSGSAHAGHDRQPLRVARAPTQQ